MNNWAFNFPVQSKTQDVPARLVNALLCVRRLTETCYKMYKKIIEVIGLVYILTSALEVLAGNLSVQLLTGKCTKKF